MTDFLGRLVQRSLPPAYRSGSPSELAPRLPSLFEPPGGDLSATEANPEGRAVQPPRAAEPRPPQEAEAFSRTIIPSLQPLPAAPRAEFPDPEPQANEAPPAEAVGSWPVVPDRSGDLPVIRARIFSHEPAPATETGIEKPAVSAAPAPLVPLPQSPLLPNRQERRVENTAALVDQPTSRMVHINIGRIEVRAVKAPPPPVPPRKTIPQTRLTIEEYLKQRNEGKR